MGDRFPRQNLTVRFQINLIELEEFDGEGAIAFARMGRCDRSFIPSQLFQQHLPRLNLLL
jgi:hypothetical protein